MSGKYTLIIIALMAALLAANLYMDTTVQPVAQVTQKGHSGKAAIGGDFSLTSHTGKAVTNKDFAGKYMVVFFGFTHCPDVCPTGLTTLTAALSALPAATVAKIQPVFITLDSARDTPAQMASYLSNFHPAIIGLTGDEAALKKAQAAYKVYAKKVETEMMGTMFDHSAFIYVMDKNGDYITHFAHKTPAQDITNRLNTIVK